MSSMEDTRACFMRVDVAVQWLLIGGSLIAALVSPAPDIFLAGYFVVGGWQVMSLLVHALAWRGRHSRMPALRTYGRIVLAIMIVTPVTLLLHLPVAFWLLYALLFLAPVMACLHAAWCTAELKQHRTAHVVGVTPGG
jgi:hypothetical protein